MSDEPGMTIHMVAYLQQQLVFGITKEAIITNRAMIKAVLDTIEANLKIVNAFNAANQKLCTHPNAVSYSDPRDSGWDCPDCGASR